MGDSAFSLDRAVVWEIRLWSITFSRCGLQWNPLSDERIHYMCIFTCTLYLVALRDFLYCHKSKVSLKSFAPRWSSGFHRFCHQLEWNLGFSLTGCFCCFLSVYKRNPLCYTYFFNLILDTQWFSKSQLLIKLFLMNLFSGCVSARHILIQAGITVDLSFINTSSAVRLTGRVFWQPL